MKPNRRSFINGLGATALSSATLGTLGASLGAFSAANAANVSGYKALVCLFFLGGQDNHDTVLPYDLPSYRRYAEIRASLIADYANQDGGNSRARSRLLPLNPINADSFGGRQFALPEQLSGIHAMFESGKASIAGNVGPLIRPINRAQWEAETVAVPKRLFSHNDQQATWMATEPEGAQYGWGGLFADAALDAGANTNEPFTTITSLGNEIFLTGRRARPYQTGLAGAPQIDLIDQIGWRDPDENLSAKLEEHFKAMQFARSNLIERDVSAAMKDSFELNALFNDALKDLAPLGTGFPQSFIGAQLRAVANTIAVRGTLGVRRQVFFVAVGGYDTHSRQAYDLPRNHKQMDDAVVAFFQAMDELGQGANVTMFTASDFGRTLAINGDGTDHGWGAHHFVIGDAVQGRTIFGDIPPYEFDHDQDAGGGRLIPSLSVEKYAEPLGRWFGLTSAELNRALPNLQNFASAEAPAFFGPST